MPVLQGGCAFSLGETTESLGVFGDEQNDASEDDFKIARDIAKRFGPLFLPVFVALLNLQPRSCIEKGNAGRFSDTDTLKRLSKVIDDSQSFSLLAELEGEAWLQPGKVHTTRYPEVAQCITMLRALTEYEAPLQQQHEMGQQVSANVEGYGIFD